MKLPNMKLDLAQEKLVSAYKKKLELPLQRFITKHQRTVTDWLDPWLKPPLEMLVAQTIFNTASLELAKGEYIELAPMRGTCSTFKLSGTSLPVFEYKVFEKKLMEFVHIRVEMSRPNRIEFWATIDSSTAPELHGKEVECKDAYRKPFDMLILQLFRYFPYYHTNKKEKIAS